VIRARPGQSLILLVLFLVALLGIAAGSITYGVVAWNQTRLQNAVDAAALAGAQLFGTGQNPTTNQAWLQRQNLGAGSAITIRLTTTPPDGVRATGTLTVPGGFARVFGIPRFVVRATAVATDAPPSPFDYAIYQHSTQMLTSNHALAVTGAVHTNGPVTVDGTYCATAGLSYGAGSPTIDGTPTCPTPVVNTGSQPWPAAWTLAQVTPPDATLNHDRTFDANQGAPYVVNGNVIFQPTGGSVSFYRGLDVNGSVLVDGNLTVDDGLTLNGSLIVWNGSATLNAGIEQSAPGPSGVALAVMGSGPGPYNLTISGGSQQTGILYVPDGTLTLFRGITLTGSLIAQTLILDDTITVHYDPQLLPPSFPVARSAHLVS